MNSYFIRHKLKAGDITNLSDQDSERLIKDKKLQGGDIVSLKTLQAQYKGQVVYVDTATIEVEVLEETETYESTEPAVKLILLQSISGESKYKYALEKSTELGVAEIYPIYTQYSLMSLKRAKSKYNSWKAVVDKAIDQSRSKTITKLHHTDELSRLDLSKMKGIKICLVTEGVETKSFSQIYNDDNKGGDLIVAIGPEKGWHSSELERFKESGFQFATLGVRMLRTETTPVVVASIFQMINGEF